RSRSSLQEGRPGARPPSVAAHINPQPLCRRRRAAQKAEEEGGKVSWRAPCGFSGDEKAVPSYIPPSTAPASPDVFRTGRGVNFGEKDAKAPRAWRDGVTGPGEETSWDSGRPNPERRYGIGLSQSISTKYPETSPKDSRTRENYITADGRTAKDHITADPGTTEDSVTADPWTTKDSVTADPGTTEDHITADPGTTEDHVTADPWTTEDSITADPGTTEDSIIADPGTRGLCHCRPMNR
uniref:protein PBMUCL2-like n=1 Tax=Callithrix jacchus TaxID=9483 RepID=UPI0023DD0400